MTNTRAHPRRRKSNATGRNTSERFVKLEYYLLNSDAFEGLSGWSVKALLLLMMRYNGCNNGEISFAVREMADALGVSKDTAAKTFKELKERGFIRCREQGAFSRKERHASVWELQMFECDGKPAGKDFMRWHAPEKQNTVTKMRTDGPKKRDQASPKSAKSARNGPENQDRLGLIEATDGPHFCDTSSLPPWGDCNRIANNRQTERGNQCATHFAFPEDFQTNVVPIRPAPAMRPPRRTISDRQPLAEEWTPPIVSTAEARRVRDRGDP